MYPTYKKQQYSPQSKDRENKVKQIVVLVLRKKPIVPNKNVIIAVNTLNTSISLVLA